ncbi:MAG: RsmB/NOP family class I SAM-dependent RNA methyltransferase [Desulfovibrionaceae bacterium]|nr:RsmB/NOP family class I SAM-dependent RNA methyltransferase [Desulfovibrionaceae bacterium]
MPTFRRSFRLVCSPADEPIVEAMLRAQGYAFEADPFFAPARRLTAEPMPLGSSLAAFFGLLYIQDRASMLPPLALNPEPGAAVLDMCASPGSKTGQLAGLVGAQGLVLGNEPSPPRLSTLRRNLAVSGLANVITCCYPGEELPMASASWDFIQLDPPCSGWGTVERHPKVRDIWKDDKTTPLIRLQRALLTEAERLLRPGGSLVYSTCTTNDEENEAHIRFARDELGLLPEALPDLPGFTLEAPRQGCEGVWRLEPRPGDTQGFFVARLRKAPGRTAPGTPTGCPHYETVPDARLLAEGVDPALLPGPVGVFNGNLHVLPRSGLGLLPAGLRWQGLYMGKVARNGDLHLSPRLRQDGPGPTLDLEGKQGLSTLAALVQGRSVTAAELPPARGGTHVLLRWNGLKLGRATLKKTRLLWAER